MPEDSEKTEPNTQASGTQASGTQASGTQASGTQAPGDQSASANMPLFYQKPEPLSASAHGGKGLRRPSDSRFAATSHAVVLHAEEFRVACAYYPIVFAGDDSAVPIAILGHDQGRNFFVDATGNWARDVYVPAYVRRYPFIHGRGAKDGDVVLYIDVASDLVVDMAENPDAEPLFVDGQPSERAKNAMDFCMAFQGQAPTTSAFVDAVKSGDMLEQRNVKVGLPGGTQRQLKGLRVISEKALNALSDAAWLEWRRRGWVSLVHWHWASLDNFARMSKLA